MIFAVLDVLLAINLCINCSFLHLLHIRLNPIPHFEFTEEFIIIKVLTKITIKHQTMMKCEVDVHKKSAVE